MHDLAVLFIHHANDATTLNNLATVRHFNPGVPVIPISNWGMKHATGHHCRDMAAGWRKLLPGYFGRGIKGIWNRFNYELDRGWIWRNVDLTAYLWSTWKDRPIQAKRWVLFEWDIYCNTRLADWFAESWDADLVASFIQRPGVQPFPHFNDEEMAIIPEKLRAYRMGANPLAGIMLSDSALSKIAHCVRETNYGHAFSEVRIATVAKSLGIPLTRNPNPLAQETLRAVTTFTMDDIDKPSVWHRVKQHETLTLIPPKCAKQAKAA